MELYVDIQETLASPLLTCHETVDKDLKLSKKLLENIVKEKDFNICAMIYSI